MEGSIINEPLFELKNQFKIVENLAKKDKNYFSMIELGDVGFKDSSMTLRVYHFYEKTMKDDNVIDCYYTMNNALHVISVDLENKVIIDSIEISENSWAICIDEEMFFHV